MGLQTQVDVFDFPGAGAPPLVASRQGEFCSFILGAGPPTVQALNGAMRLALEATDEAQAAGLYFGDILTYDIDFLIRATFYVKVGTIAANESAIIGMASNRNAAFDTIAEAALFKFDASNACVVESDDGTNNNDDVASGFTPGTGVFSRYQIDFATRVLTQDPPAASLGGKANVEFAMSNANGNLRRVADGTLFNMNNYAGRLQPIVELQKASGTGVPTVDIRRIEIEHVPEVNA